MWQSVNPGEGVDKGTAIDLWVSKGPEIPLFHFHAINGRIRDDIAFRDGFRGGILHFYLQAHLVLQFLEGLPYVPAIYRRHKHIVLAAADAYLDNLIVVILIFIVGMGYFLINFFIKDLFAEAPEYEVPNLLGYTLDQLDQNKSIRNRITVACFCSGPVLMTRVTSSPFSTFMPSMGV